MNRPQQGDFRGVEIQILDGERVKDKANTNGTVRGSGPEQDPLRHWVSENGIGMALAQRIVRAHGGKLTAAGVAGTGVSFILRIPQDRVTGGLISKLDSPRVQPLFSEHAMGRC
ncbi:ATP-binding protein [Bdellovibrionota bacterium FG-2]